MATEYTDIAEAQNAMNGVQDRPAESRRTSGAVHRIVSVFTIGAATAQGDIVRLARIPRGALFVPQACFVVGEADYAADALSLIKVGVEYDDGSAGNPDDLASVVVPDNGVATHFTGGDSIVPVEYDKDGWLIATLTGIDTPDEDKRLVFVLEFLL